MFTPEALERTFSFYKKVFFATPGNSLGGKRRFVNNDSVTGSSVSPMKTVCTFLFWKGP
jgi:hypothetical protein